MTNLPLIKPPNSDDIVEVFSRDPLEMDDVDIDTIIRRFREKRAEFALAERTKKPGSGPKIKKLDLADLGI